VIVSVILFLMCIDNIFKVFNMESEYNSKNRQRMLPVDDRPQWDEIFGAGKVYAVSTGRVCCITVNEK